MSSTVQRQAFEVSVVRMGLGRIMVAMKGLGEYFSLFMWNCQAAHTFLRCSPHCVDGPLPLSLSVFMGHFPLLLMDLEGVEGALLDTDKGSGVMACSVTACSCSCFLHSQLSQQTPVGAAQVH